MNGLHNNEYIPATGWGYRKANFCRAWKWPKTEEEGNSRMLPSVNLCSLFLCSGVLILFEFFEKVN